MKPFILIREYRKTDDIFTQELIKQYIMSYAWSSFIQVLFREITLQLVVLMWAILFIFVGIPLHLCFLSIPVVIFLIIFCVYAVHFNKGIEMANANPKCCFVAEAYEEPLLLLNNNDEKIEYDIVDALNGFDVNTMKKKIVGTISIRSHESLHNSGWLYRFAIDHKYPYSDIVEGLTKKAIQHSASQGWGRLETVTTECQDEVRESYSKLGFTIRQVYHRQIVGSSLRVMKTQLGLDVVKYMAANIKHQ
uniref:CSON002342 protein n=2 Tax=Culicoides sonorensis TaxID=179676 RepID=A0A336MLC1_CULSO